ncbi:MAG: 3-dehydroquinate synthase [Proteobacteria bacterium]|nr:3-dehydroquinate synthase [Pseudomonadota bacterium]
MSVLHKVDVKLSGKSYSIHIGRGLLHSPGQFVPFSLKDRSLFVLTDENVANPHGLAVYEGLKATGARSVEILAIPGGEQSKSLSDFERVVSWMLDRDVDRQSVLFAVGGGVIGDLAGFAASVVMRGIAFVQIPTTLLAQVDSSVGGKTGINMPQGKNMVGTFHQPAAVVCDMDTLKTLPQRDILAGYAEIIKYALIDDPSFFIWLEGNGKKVCEKDPEALARAVATACRKKAEIVGEDEKEHGRRMILNLGHTFGHALEAATGYDGRLVHGEAVAIGTALAFRLSVRMGLCAEKDADHVVRHLKDIGLPTRIDMISPSLHDAKEIMGFMVHDKKASSGKIIFILSRGIGNCFAADNVRKDDLEAILVHSMKKG